MVNQNYYIFLIPKANNLLAEYIALKDPWYCKFVYIPFVHNLILPIHL